MRRIGFSLPLVLGAVAFVWGGMPVLGAAPATAPAAAGFAPADYARHVAELKKRMPAGFHVVVQPPFVVVGDGEAAAVKRHAVGTVKWAVDRLKQDYFTRDPADIIDVWLFKDKASYDRYTREIFKDEPGTPYGYYSPAHKALIMNISTGGGTLVHEIVHPFMHANFPACPPWFNEGMGSLYEQCGDENGHIHGYTNWRLAGLQKGINAKSLPPFQELMGMDHQAFYTKDRGTNYAQARYLCYYLQQQGLLVKFYKEFVAAQAADPSGFKTLQKVMGEADVPAFQRRWEAWVLKLRFP